MDEKGKEKGISSKLNIAIIHPDLGIGCLLFSFSGVVAITTHNCYPIEEATTGGFDKCFRENVEYLEELKSLAETAGVSGQVNFITSCSTAVRNEILSQCLCVLYTPKDEHFGIVHLETMAAQKPVIAFVALWRLLRMASQVFSVNQLRRSSMAKLIKNTV